MPLKKLVFNPGINREKTRYANEGTWYEGDKIRFRQGLPECIGGWRRISSGVFLGICRSLNVWASNNGVLYTGVGTHLKFYIENGGTYYDITPIRVTTPAGDITFGATSGSTLLTVTDVAHGAEQNDFVTFSGAVSLGGVVTAAVLNQEYQVATVLTDDTYTVTLDLAANASDTGNGGVAVVGEYQINTGPEIVQALNGWGAGPWGLGAWGIGQSNTQGLRLWSQSNFGEDLVFGPKGGALYYWDATGGVNNNRGVLVSSLVGASDVPLVQNFLIESDLFRFTFAFGTNNIGETTIDNMLVRWSDQEDITNWTPQAVNQAGSLRLSRGSEIVTAIQARQELLVWSDTTLYSFQYIGAPAVWAAQVVGANISIVSQMCVAFANGVAYWMGKDGFYQYDGRLTSMSSDVRRYVFEDINRAQYEQCFTGTVEAFNEIWFFYCSADSTTINRYVTYNYVQGIWATGTLNRSAWEDSGLLDYPIGASYSHNICDHEFGLNDNETAVEQPITSFVQSGEFDIDDGDRVMYIWRCLPDVNFVGSAASNPSVEMTFIPRYSSGGPLNNPLSQGGNSDGMVTRTSTVPVQEYTAQINLRVRGRQLAVRLESNTLDTQWQLGTPRIDMRPDGRR